MSSSNWIGSLNVQSYVQGLMQQATDQLHAAAQNGPIKQLTAQQTSLNTQLSNYGKMQNYLNTLQTDIGQLTNNFSPSYQIGYSTSGIVNAQINGTVTPGTHDLTVTQMAQATSVASGPAGSSTGALNNIETINLSIGPSGSPTASMSVNVSATDSLQSIATAINAAAKTNNMGINASVISTGAGEYKLLVSSTQTGLANQVNIGETITSGAGLGITTGDSGTATVLTAAQDAQFTYDKMSFSQSTNSVTIQGMNLSLLSKGTTTISVNPSSSQAGSITTSLQTLINDYNAFDNFVETTQASSSAPNAVMDSVLSQVQNVLGAVYSGTGTGTLKTLSDIGVTANSQAAPINIILSTGQPGQCYLTGQLQLDTTKLSTALTNNLANVQTLLSGTSGILTKAQIALQPNTGPIWKVLNDPISGAIQQTNTQLNTVAGQMTDETNRISDQTNQLLLQYGQLSLTLSNLQGQGQYVAQQVTILNSTPIR